MTNRKLGPVPEEVTRRAASIESWLLGYSAKTSRSTMLSRLRAVARAAKGLERRAHVDVAQVEWETFEEAHVFNVVRDRLVDRYGLEQSARYVIAMRALLHHLAVDGVADYDMAVRTLDGSKVRRILSDAPSLKFTSGDLRRHLQACHDDPSTTTGLRDLAMISLAATTGARRRELVQILMSDIDLDSGEVALSVKGGGRRRAALHHATADHLKRWLLVRGDDDGPLFPALRKGGHFTENPVSDHQFWKILRRRCEQAGVNPVIAPHDLRRWFVSSLLDSGVDVFQVARAVGHARVATTQRYDRRPLERLRQVVDLLSLPLFSELEEGGQLSPDA